MSDLPQEYGQLISELMRRAALSGQPVDGTFELTERCNLACGMCYIGRAAGDVAARSRELSASQWVRLARDAAENGMVFLLLTGGEVFLRRDFFEIYMPLTGLGLVLTLFTNGTLVTERVAAHLAEAPPSRTEVTLYGATASTYEAITGIPGSYARCCAGIEALIRNRVPLGLKTTVSRKNISELDAMRQMARNWGVPFSAAWLITRRRDGTPSEAENYRLSSRDSVALEASDRASAAEWAEVALHGHAGSGDGNFPCHAGRAAFAVNPFGEMNPCIDLKLPAVRPLDLGFREAWAQLQRFVEAAPRPDARCVACDVQAYCPRCPAWSSLETGTLTAPVPYLCEIAHARQRQYQ